MKRLASTIVALAALAALAAAAAAHAQPVWRCGPDGRTYTDEACAGGVAVQVADARTAEQRLQAGRDAAREAAFAARLVRERQQREAAWQPAAAVRIGPAAESLRRPREQPPLLAPQARPRAAAAGARTSPSAARASRRAPG